MQAANPRKDKPQSPKALGSSTRPTLGMHSPGTHSTPTTIALVLAVAALFARAPDGTSYLPPGLELVAQLPAWILTACALITRRRTANIILLITVTIAGIVLAARQSNPLLLGIVLTGYIAGDALLQKLIAIAERIEHTVDKPQKLMRILLRRWIMMILVAATLLALPVATQSGVPDYRHNLFNHILDSAFAAASSATLTGLTIQSFGEDYTLFGKAVLILVTQLSGMAFASVGLAIIRPFLWRPVRFRTVLLVAIVLQLLAVVIMYSAWRPEDAPSAIARIGWSLTYATSAIWNGGLSLRFDGLAAYLTDYRVSVVITSLAIIGSLGLPILIELILPQPAEAVAGSSKSLQADSMPYIKARLRKLPEFEAVAATVLLALGALALWYFNHPRCPVAAWGPTPSMEIVDTRIASGEIPSEQRWAMSLLTSATLRSAGIQSIPVTAGALSWCGWFVMLTWIVIGGSAAGVGGGLRTAMLTLPLVARKFKADPTGPASELRRTLLRQLRRFALIWIVANVAAIGIIHMTTDATHYESITDGVAATNNVGISTGLYVHLTPFGRIAMIVIFIVGRFAPMYFWLSIAAAVRNTLSSTDTETA